MIAYPYLNTTVFIRSFKAWRFIIGAIVYGILHNLTERSFEKTKIGIYHHITFRNYAHTAFLLQDIIRSGEERHL